MILLRLLSAGKTLVGVGDKQSAYRLREKNCLPKFGGKENPFRATTFPEATGGKVAAAVEEPAKTEGAPLASVSAAILAPVEHATSARVPARRTSARKHWESFRGWMKSGSARSEVRAPGEHKSLPEQGELKLDSVRVVRNDLTDGDMLVGPRRSAAQPTQSEQAEQDGREPAPAVLNPAEPDSAWSRVSARIFGTENTR